MAQPFIVERIQGQQFADGVDNGHAEGADGFIRLDTRFRIADLSHEGPLAGQPVFNMKSRGALSHHLELVVFFIEGVNLDQAPVFREIFRRHRIRVVIADIDQPQRLMWGLTDSFQGRLPAFLVQHHRLYQPGHERPVLDGNQVDALGFRLVRQRQAARGLLNSIAIVLAHNVVTSIQRGNNMVARCEKSIVRHWGAPHV